MTRAVLRNNQASPTKVRLVLNQIRGLDVTEARELLRFSQRGASAEIAKLLDSAVANAEHNDHIPSDELFIAATWADEGPTGKRFRPRARGRGTRILKRTSHITIVVERYSDDELRARAVREEASGSGAAAERRRRLSRGRRVAASTAAAEAHDHDHDHDHDHEDVVEADTTEVAETESPEIEAGEDAATEATTETDAEAVSEDADADTGESDTGESDDSSKGEQ